MPAKKYIYPPIEDIIKARKEGISFRKQAISLGISCDAFYAYCKYRAVKVSLLIKEKVGKITKEDIINNFKSGIFAKEQAKLYGLTLKTFSKHCRSLGIANLYTLANKYRGSKCKDLSVQKILEGLKKGITLGEQAKQYGIPRENFIDYCSRNGIRQKDYIKKESLKNKKQKDCYDIPSPDEVKNLISKGFTFTELAKLYNTPFKLFYQHYKYKGITRGSILKNEEYKKIFINKLESVNFFEEYWINNLSIKKIANKNSLNKQTISNWINNAGIKTKDALREKQISEIIKLYEKGKSCEELEELFNLPYKIIKKIITIGKTRKEYQLITERNL